MGCGFRDERIPFQRALGGVVVCTKGMTRVGDRGIGEESFGTSKVLVSLNGVEG